MDIFKALSRSLHFEKDVDFKKLANGTKGFSGADIQAVLYTAQLYAVEDALRLGKVRSNILCSSKMFVIKIIDGATVYYPS